MFNKRSKGAPAIRLGDVFPDFSADSTVGKIDWHKYIEGSWAILFSHPDDFTPVCTTELGTMAKLAPEFEKRGVKLAGLSCNGVDSHKAWIEDIEATHYSAGSKVPYPIISDPKRELAVKLNMLDPAEKDKEGLPLTARALFIIGPDKKLKLQILYPATTGRNMTEVLRVVDSLQMTLQHSVATPVEWQHGQDVMVIPSLSDEDAQTKLGDMKVLEVPSGKRYLRLVADPTARKM